MRGDFLEGNNGAGITAVLLTYNEEDNVERCLDSVSDWVQDIVVVDSYSEDSTVELARQYTDRIVEHEFVDHPRQWSWVLENVTFDTDWILALDADFVVTDDLRRAILSKFGDGEPEEDGFYLRVRKIFRGKTLKHGSLYPRYWLRLFRQDKVFLDQSELVDAHFYVEGETGKIEEDIIEKNENEWSIDFWINKQMSYAERHAAEEIVKRREGPDLPQKPSLLGSPNHRNLGLKQIWYRLPLFVRPFLLFFYRYLVRLGFLDGRQGLIYHFTQALFYRFMVDVRMQEMDEETALGYYKRIEDRMDKGSGASVKMRDDPPTAANDA